MNKSLNCYSQYSDIKITLKKRNGHRIRQISIRWIITCGAQCWDAIRNTRQNRPTLLNWRLPCCRYGTICRRSSLIRQSSHFKRNFDRVLLQLVDILNTRFKYREVSWHLSLKRLNWWWKVVQTLIRYYWIFRTGLLFTFKSEFESLNCCIYWITSVFVMKFAAYVAWILLYKCCKFGQKKSATIPEISNFS